MGAAAVSPTSASKHDAADLPLLVSALRAQGCCADPRGSWGLPLSVTAGRTSAAEARALLQIEWARDDEPVHSLQVFTDGSAELCSGWPQVVSLAAFSVVFFALTDEGLKLVGAIAFPFQQAAWCTQPSPAAAELAALAVAARSLALFAPRPVEMYSDCLYAVDLLCGR